MNKLPNEILEKIFLYYKYNFNVYKSVCKRWYIIIKNIYLINIKKKIKNTPKKVKIFLINIDNNFIDDYIMLEFINNYLLIDFSVENDIYALFLFCVINNYEYSIKILLEKIKDKKQIVENNYIYKIILNNINNSIYTKIFDEFINILDISFFYIRDKNILLHILKIIEPRLEKLICFFKDNILNFGNIKYIFDFIDNLYYVKKDLEILNLKIIYLNFNKYKHNLINIPKYIKEDKLIIINNKIKHRKSKYYTDIFKYIDGIEKWSIWITGIKKYKFYKKEYYMLFINESIYYNCYINDGLGLFINSNYENIINLKKQFLLLYNNNSYKIII